MNNDRAVSIYTRNTDGFEASVHYYVVSSLLLAWFCAFLYPHVVITDIVSQIKNANNSTEKGDLFNQVLIVSFSLLGIVHLPETGRLLSVIKVKRLSALLGMYLGWCALSISWSLDPLLSARRFISLLLIIVGSVGLGAGFYGRLQNGLLILARHVILSASLCVMFLLYRIATSGQDITAPQWTLKYTAQIETYAFPLGYAIIAAVYLYRDRVTLQLFFISLYFSVLVLLKGRTLLLDVLSAAAISYSRLTLRPFLRLVTIVIGLGVGAILIDLVTGGQLLIAFVLTQNDYISSWLPYISIGEGLRNITQLSGRLPLWQALIPSALASPFVGHGFGAFWTPDRFGEIFSAVKWYAVVAHNGFLEEILATGLIGLVLLAAFWIYGMYLAWSLGRSGVLIFAWLLVFLYFNTMASIIESYFQYPTFISFIALGLLASELAALDKCEHCGATLIKKQTDSGDLLLCHP